MVITAVVVIVPIVLSTEALEFESLPVLIGMSAFHCFTAVGLILRTNWGRSLGFICGSLMHLGFPIGTLIGALFLTSLARGTRLFGPDRLPHQALDAEWKHRRKCKVP